jgi:hypothetical protein
MHMLWAAFFLGIFLGVMMPAGGGVLYPHQVPGSEAGSDGGAAGEGGLARCWVTTVCQSVAAERRHGTQVAFQTPVQCRNSLGSAGITVQ